MKTAISIPDKVFQSAEELANRLGKSRSQLYAQAVNSYVESHRRDNVTSKLNKVYKNEGSRLDPEFSAQQFRSLLKDKW